MELSVRKAAAECGGRIAVVLEDHTLSYAELAAKVAGTCAELTRRGLDSSTLVAICASNRGPTLIAVLAFIELGIPFVAVHPRWTEREVAVVMSDAKPRCLFGDAEVDSLMVGTSIWTDSACEIPGAAPLAILYSSGTSGTPKGAILSRSAFVASAQGSAENLGFFEDDRWLLCLPLCHIGGLSIVMRCLLARSTVVLLPRFDAQAVLAAIVRNRVTLLSVVPVMLQGLLDADREGVLRSVRAVLSGGAATPLSLLTRAVGAGVNVLTTYGLTEACSQVTVQKWKPTAVVRSGSGTPLSGLELSIRGEEGIALVPHTVGRVWVRGRSMMTGYVGKEPLGDGWFDTGDLGELDDEGVLLVHSRRMDLIVTGGENVYPAEVEQALLLVPHVRSAVVFGVPDPQWGAVVAAAIVVLPEFQESSLTDVINRSLASFKRPRLWVTVDAIPQLANGKIDRRTAIAAFTPLLRKLRA